MAKRTAEASGASTAAPSTGTAESRAGTGGTAGPAADTRWLNEDELAAWWANSAIMISLPAALDARMQRETPLTFFEYMVLSVLSEQPGRTLRMSELAGRTSASLSRLSHVVGRLEKRGLIERARVPGAGRRTVATLTEAGLREVEAAAPGHVAAVREYLIDQLGPDDLAALRRIGNAVNAAVNRRPGADPDEEG
jgi:DNA-binding MarR family transcriptional regulator